MNHVIYTLTGFVVIVGGMTLGCAIILGVTTLCQRLYFELCWKHYKYHMSFRPHIDKLEKADTWKRREYLGDVREWADAKERASTYIAVYGFFLILGCGLLIISYGVGKDLLKGGQ